MDSLAKLLIRRGADMNGPFQGPGWKEREVRKNHPFYVVLRPQYDIVMETEYRCLQSETKQSPSQYDCEKSKQTKKVSKFKQ
jgi:hypothetical protein